MNNKDDLVITKADFVIQHQKGKKLTEFYLVDGKVLGEGAFGKV